MEEIVFMIIQLIMEIGAHVLFDSRSGRRTTPENKNLRWTCFFWLLGGCALAILTIYFTDFRLIENPLLRLLNMILAPVLAAELSKRIARHRAKSNPNIIPRNHYWYAFWFTLGLVLVRFPYA